MLWDETCSGVFCLLLIIPKFSRSSIGLLSFFFSPQPFKCPALAVVGISIFRGQVDRAIEVSDGPLVLSEVPISNAPIVEDIGIARSQVESTIEVSDGPLVLFETTISIASTVVDISIVGSQVDRVIKVSDGPLVFTEATISNTPMVVGLG